MHLSTFFAIPVIAAGLLAGAAAHAAPKVPLSAFVQEDQFTNPRLSPDGKHIAITVRVPSGDRFVPVVMFYSLPDLKQVGAVRMPAFQVPLDYRWVSNARVVITKGRELGSREKPVSTGEVLATNFDGRQQEYLFGYEMFNSSKRGDRYPADYAHGQIESLPRVLNGHFYLSSHAWTGDRSMLYDIDSSSAIRRLIANVPAPGMDFLIQNNGTPRFASGIGDDSYALMYRYNDATAAWEKLTDMGRRFEFLSFLPDDASFIARYSAKGGPEELIQEELATGKRTVLFADKESSVGTLEFGAKRDLPFAAATSVGIPRPRYFNADSDDAKLHKTLSAAFPDAVVHFINFTEDGNTLLFAVTSDRDPGSFYLFQRSTGKADLLFSSMAEIEPGDMRERTPISFTSRDGITIHGILTMPDHAAGAKVPMVIMPHGGPHGIYDRWYFETDAQFLASRGYAVLEVNFRGSGGRGVNFEHAGYHQWGGKMQDDMIDGIKWAIAKNDIDGARVCSYGASYGGYSALMLAAREPDLIKCAVGYAGVYDLKMLLVSENAKADKSTANYFKRVLGEDRAELDRFSPVLQADKIKAPVLLVHGGKDKRAPLEHAEAMREALIKVNRPPEWLLAPNEGHGFYDTANRTKFYQALEAFLEKHIGH